MSGSAQCSSVVMIFSGEEDALEVGSELRAAELGSGESFTRDDGYLTGVSLAVVKGSDARMFWEDA